VNVDVNGASRPLADGTTVALLLDELAAPTRGTAVVVDGEVVPRSEWGSFELRAGHTVELVTAVQGG
jgi:sulfur carrier protein